MARSDMHPLLLVTVLVAFSTLAVAEIRLQQADRKIQLQSQFARITETLKFKNNGDGPVDRVTLCTMKALADKVAHQKVKDTSSSKDSAPLKVQPTAAPGAPAGVACFDVLLTSSLPGGEVATLLVESTLPNVQTPFPASIMQADTQLVLYLDNVYIVSPYPVSAQTTEVLLASNTVKSYTDTEKPTSKSDSKVKYGRYDKQEPFSMKEMRIHFENQKPFRTALTLVREITVSHWGNIYVEEVYELKHTGAKHTGPFSRLKYAHSHNGKANSYQDLRARLPASAHHLYYVDIIGNISSSDTRKSPSGTVLDFKTRYPLMGGWKVDFTLGYSVPLAGFLFKKATDGKYRLTMDFSTPIEDVFVEDLIVRVVLPEGCTDINSIISFPVETSFDKKFTYLDTTGRPVLVMHKRNVVPDHAVKFSVDYAFSTTDMLREPLLLIGVFAALFALAIAYNRLELTISRDDKWEEAQSVIKLATDMQQLNVLVESEGGLLGQLARLVNLLRDPEDVDPVVADRVTLDKKLKELDEQVQALQLKLTSSKSLSTAVAGVQEKVRSTHARVTRLISERVDLVKKGTPVLDISKKLAPGVAQVQDGQRELSELATSVFSNY